MSCHGNEGLTAASSLTIGFAKLQYGELRKKPTYIRLATPKYTPAAPYHAAFCVIAIPLRSERYGYGTMEQAFSGYSNRWV